MLITSMIANFYLLYGYMSFSYDFQAISDRWTFHHIIPEFPSFFRIDWSNRIPFGRPDLDENLDSRREVGFRRNAALRIVSPTKGSPASGRSPEDLRASPLWPCAEEEMRRSFFAPSSLRRGRPDSGFSSSFERSRP